MHIDPLSFVLAAAFLAGCLVIDACRGRPDDVTAVLALVMIGLANLSGAALLARTGPALNPQFAVELVVPHRD